MRAHRRAGAWGVMACGLVLCRPPWAFAAAPAPPAAIEASEPSSADTGSSEPAPEFPTFAFPMLGPLFGSTPEESTDAPPPDSPPSSDTGGATAPTGLETADIVKEASRLEERFRRAEEDIASTERVERVAGRFAMHEESWRALEGRVEHDALRRLSRPELSELDRQLQVLQSSISGDLDGLEDRIRELGELERELEGEQKRWETKRNNVRDSPSVPPVALARTGEILSLIRALRPKVAERIASTIELQSQVSELLGKVRGADDRVADAEVDQRSARLSQTAPPLWKVTQAWTPEPSAYDAWSPSGAWALFYGTYGHLLPLDALLGIALLTAVIWLGRWAATPGSKVDPDSVVVLRRPLAAAFLALSLSVRLLFPGAPTIVLYCADAVSVVPLVRLLPFLLRGASAYRSSLWVLSVFAASEIVSLAPLPRLVSRLANLALTLALLLWCVRVLRAQRTIALGLGPRLERLAPSGLKLMVVLAGLALLAEVFGYVQFAGWAVPGMLFCVYALLALSASAAVATEVVSVAIRTPWARLSRTLRLHGGVVEPRLQWGINAVAVVAWVLGALRTFDIDGPLWRALNLTLDRTVGLGNWAFSLRDATNFGIVIVLTITVSRAVVFVVDQDVLPRFSMPRGAPSTVSRLVRYAVLGLGFVLAIGASGIDLTHVALLASALSVGIGFGLQNVVNNFVSGLILIFERPIREGDTVELGGILGEVRKIGMRASIVRTLEGAEVVVPNADLISSQVTNWTLSDQKKRMSVAVGVAYGTNPNRVLRVLDRVAAETESILREPPPVALFRGFGDSSLDFELRFWLNLRDDWPVITSNVTVRIESLLSEEGIEIPFPQRDLHLRSISPGALERLERADRPER